MDIEGEGMELGLPVDVLTEILSRIPAKSLLRFKSVCKYWYSLIQNPSFISLHHTRAQPNHGLVLVHPHEDEHSMYLLPNQTSFQRLDLSFTGLNVNKNLRLKGWSNGVLCLSNLNDFQNPTHVQILICNPATREFRLLPQPPYHTLRTSMLWFVFHPETNGSYRVIRVATLFRSDLEPYDPYDDINDHAIFITPVDHKIHVYDVGMDSWREIMAIVPNFFFNPDYADDSFGSALIRGDFHRSYFDFDSAAFRIGVMRTFQESFEQIALPKIFSAKFVRSRVGMLCVLKDSLALVFEGVDFKPKEMLFDIWVMEEYGVEESWTKKYSIGPLLGFHFPLGFRPNDEVLLMVIPHLLWGPHGNKLVSYNLSTNDTNEYNQLCDRPSSRLQCFFPYAESLVSINRAVV